LTSVGIPADGGFEDINASLAFIATGENSIHTIQPSLRSRSFAIPELGKPDTAPPALKFTGGGYGTGPAASPTHPPLGTDI
jgi:hypothetical protein